jgi:hypothetical protein
MVTKGLLLRSSYYHLILDILAAIIIGNILNVLDWKAIEKLQYL